jgi:glutathione S-transferase
MAVIDPTYMVFIHKIDVVISETNAIIDYILDVSTTQTQTTQNNRNDDDPTLLPPHQQQQQQQRHTLTAAAAATMRPGPGSTDRVDYLFVYHGAQGSFGPVVTQDYVWRLVVSKVPCLFRCVLRAVYGQLNATVFEPRITKFMQLIESMLDKDDGQRQFVSSKDNLTAADITLIFPMEEVLKESSLMRTRFPRCEEWRQRMYRRDAHKRAMEKVGEKNAT